MLRSVLLAALLFVCATAMLNAQTTASVPRALSYQGVLTEPNGTLMQDGEYTISVRLYDELNAANPIYIEQHKVIVVRGLFNLLIGSQIPIPAAVRFDRAYFLGVSVNGTEEMKPRTPLTASPYALRAETAARADVATVAENLAPNAKAVSSVNSLSGDVMLKAGTGIALNQQGNEITITSTPANGTAADNKGNKLLGTYGFTGDLTGTANTNANFGSWSVRIAQNGATNGQVLQWNTSQGRWIPGTISTTPTGTAGGSLSGSYPNPSLVANSVGTTQIANGAVTDAKVASGISASKISGDISGNAANVTGTVALANGGTGATTATGARTNLGLGSLATQNSVTTNEITDGTITAADLNQMSATTGQVLAWNGTAWTPTLGSTGTVTSVNISGGTTGLTASGGPITSSGSLTLAGTLALANGGTGATTATSARTNLGLGTLATQNSVGDADITDVAGSKVTGNISGNSANVTGIVALANGGTGATTATGARTNLGLGTLATQNGTFSGTSSGINTGDQDLSGLMLKSANLSDVASVSTARTNLGLGSLATKNTIATADIDNAAVTLTKISSSGASSGNVLTYNGTNVVWAAPSGGGGTAGAFAAKSSDETFTTTTIGDVADLTITLEAGKTYSLQSNIFHTRQNNTTSDGYQIKLTYTGTLSFAAYAFAGSSNGNNYQSPDLNFVFTSNLAGSFGTVVNLDMSGLITTTTGGTLKLQFAKNVTTNNNPTIMKAGSYITAVPLN